MRYETFNDVDADLRRLCEIEVEIKAIEGEITLKINELKDAYAEQIALLNNEADFIKQEIEDYCAMNKADFAQKRSKELIFGTIGYRMSQSVSLPRNKDKVEALIKSIKSYGYKNCIVYEEKPDKDALCELEDRDLVKLGLKRVVKDNFRIEPKIESLQYN